MGQYQPLSPLSIDHLIKGYFAWMGTAATAAVDYGIKPMLDRGERPAQRIDDIFLIGSFVKELPAANSRYVGQLYDMAKDIDQAYASWREALKLGRPDDAARIYAQNRSQIQAYKQVEGVKRQLSVLNAQAKRTEASADLTGEDKRTKLTEIAALKNRLARGVSERLRGL